jgi:para-aminobenzoate synthetase/4-amino-4-deoxychorismate lyase
VTTIITRHPSGTRDWVVWQHPVDIIATSDIGAVQSCLTAIEARVNQGLMALGFVTYEAGLAFDPHFASKHDSQALPLVWFALFNEYAPYDPPRSARAAPSTWKPSITQRAYKQSIGAIKQRIAAGDTYQVNYTFPLVARGPIALREVFFYLAENQPTPHATLIETPDFQIASVSPELFFELNGTNVRVEPMKGTCPRGPHPELDVLAGEQLRTSEKNRAENIMIVDMMRNDLGRIAEPGSVSVDALFTVTPWPTLWQMTSSVSARTSAGVPEIFAALFPCASITGAPKLKTSEIIAELEPTPRGLYTGAIGWWLPGRHARFAVAIRTMVHTVATRETRYGIGSGIVWDSQPADEYRECLLKARVLDRAPPAFRLLETLRWEKACGYVMLEEHLKRLMQSASYFGVPSDRAAIAQRMEKVARHLPDRPHRVRVLVGRAGNISIQAKPLDQPGHFATPEHAPALTASVDQQHTDPDSLFLYHKTTRRLIYQRARKRYPIGDDVLLVNTRNELMEFTNGNLVLRCGTEWLTPELASGILPGVFREKLIADRIIRPARLTRSDLDRADAIYFINSVRGWRAVTLIPATS